MEEKHVTLKDIATAAGVSISTVSHVINNTRYVKQETRKLVEDTMQGLSFERPKPNSKKLKYIGLIVADITEDYSIAVIKAIENHCKALNASVVVNDSEDDPEIEEQNVVKMLSNERISGIIISPVDSTRCPKLLASSHIPVVCFDRKYDRLNKIFFGINNLGTGVFATRYLMSHGCRRIGFIGYPSQIYSVHQRELGYKLEVQEKFPQGHPLIKQIEYFQTDAVEQVMAFLEKEKIDGIICATSGVCHLAVEGIARLGLSIPEDMKVVTYDDNRWLDFLKYPISVITQPTQEIARAAVEQVVNMIEGGDELSSETSEVYFETGFIDRLKTKEN
ncbi:MAG: LacI family transcriptional regulator [Spirochaetia bacterium]|jgi:LacI family transcriptional regulator|nr:LacI family transcriptional regulator [Spirochaetia bacterium]